MQTVHSGVRRRTRSIDWRHCGNYHSFSEGLTDTNNQLRKTLQIETRVGRIALTLLLFDSSPPSMCVLLCVPLESFWTMTREAPASIDGAARCNWEFYKDILTSMRNLLKHDHSEESAQLIQILCVLASLSSEFEVEGGAFRGRDDSKNTREEGFIWREIRLEDRKFRKTDPQEAPSSPSMNR